MGRTSPRNQQVCSRALHVSHNVLFRNKLLRRNFHLTFSVGMKIKLVHEGGGPPGVKYNREIDYYLTRLNDDLQFIIKVHG